MRILFDGEAHTDYSQIHVMSGPETEGDLTTAFAGQRNGLCGGGPSPGFLYLVTGLYYGRVGLTVELHDEAPPVDDC
jgi:hypothetical protein